MKLVCKYCGHDKFSILNKDQSQCRKCLKTINSMDDLEEDSPDQMKLTKDQIAADALTYYMRIVGRLNIVKKEIDTALDEENKEKFLKYTNELKRLENLLLEFQDNGSAKA